jgi:hypothetical protein
MQVKLAVVSLLVAVVKAEDAGAAGQLRGSAVDSAVGSAVGSGCIPPMCCPCNLQQLEWVAKYKYAPGQVPAQP